MLRPLPALRSLLSLVLVLGLVVVTGGCEEDLPGAIVPDGGAGDDDDDDVDTFDQLFATSEFQMCADCHAPGAPGFTDETESSLDFSSRDAAAASLQGTVTGLTGTNFEDCEGVPFLGTTREESLLVAYFDATVRAAFTSDAVPVCNGDAIADGTLRVGSLSPATSALLDAWIAEGAPE